MHKPTPQPALEIRYRIVCYELEDGRQTVILDATARGFIAVTGTIDEDGTMRGEGTHAGPLAPEAAARPPDRRRRATRRLKRSRPPYRLSVRGSPYGWLPCDQ